MLASEPPPVEWLLDGVAARGHVTLLAGREKQGKSLLVLGLAAASVSGGASVAGIECDPCRVLVVDAENGEREIHRRVRKLGLTQSSVGRLAYRCAVGFDLRAGLAELRAATEEERPDLLVLDSFRSLWRGNENDTGEAAAALDPLRHLAHQLNVGIVLIHHQGKQGIGYRGSTSIGASAEHLLSLERVSGDPDRTRRKLSNDGGCRFDAEVADRWLSIEADPRLGFLVIDPAEPFDTSDDEAARTAPVREAISSRIEALLTPTAKRRPELARAVNRDPKDQTVRRALRELAEAGLAKETPEGWVSGCQVPIGVMTPDTPSDWADSGVEAVARIRDLFRGTTEISGAEEVAA
jgi:AAA domain